jgi:glycosyltransferase involved in cell wall biosynthesis
MQIVHVIDGLTTAAGGPTFALIGQAQAQAKMNLKVRVISTWRQGESIPASASLSQAGAEIVPIALMNRIFKSISDARNQLHRLLSDADVVHIHGIWANIHHQTAVICRELGKPYIFHPCGMLDPWSLRRKWLKKRLYLALRLRRDLEQARAIHVASLWERDRTALLGLKRPLVIVPDGVDLDEFGQLPARGRFRDKYPALQNRSLIVFLGRIYPGKGLELLVSALSKLADRSTMLAVVGPDSQGYQATVQSCVDKLKLGNRVVFTGLLQGNNRIEALVDADLFCLPSEHENFGIAVMEALASGTPAIISDQVAIHHEVVLAGAGESLPLDVDRFVDALQRWLNDPNKRRIAGEAGRKLALTDFNWDRIAQLWMQVYREHCQ